MVTLLLNLLQDAIQVIGLRRLQSRELLVRHELLQPHQLADGQDVPVVEICGARGGQCAADGQRARSPRLVHQVSDWCSGAAANFGWMREAKRENTRCGLLPMSDKAAGQKARSPQGCDENGPAAALLLSHVSI